MPIGETLALLCAISWSFAVILFKKSGETVSPLGLNLYKNLLTIVLLIPTTLIIEGTLFHQTDSKIYLLLLFSGFLGITLADTFYFKTLNILGASITSIVGCLYSPIVIILSVLYLKETISFYQVIGISMIVLATIFATLNVKEFNLTWQNALRGIIYCLIGLILMGISIIIIKPHLDTAPVFWVTSFRLLGGLLGFLIIIPFSFKGRKSMKTIFKSANFSQMTLGCFLGGYLAMTLWVGGFKYTSASIASVLNQTATIFTIILAAFLLKETLNKRKIFSAILALSGVVVITVFKN